MANEQQNGSPLFNFLADLARDENLLRRFQEDPEAVLSQYDLPEDAREAILASWNDSSEEEQLLNAISAEGHRLFRTGGMRRRRGAGTKRGFC